VFTIRSTGTPRCSARAHP